MSGNAPNLIDGHAYCASEDCWNIVPDNGASDLCADCDDKALAIVAAALAPFGFKLEHPTGDCLLIDTDLARTCTVEAIVLGDNEDGWPPLSLDENCTLRVVVYTGEDVADFFPFAGTVAELVSWLSR